MVRMAKVVIAKVIGVVGVASDSIVVDVNNPNTEPWLHVIMKEVGAYRRNSDFVWVNNRYAVRVFTRDGISYYYNKNIITHEYDYEPEYGSMPVGKLYRFSRKEQSAVQKAIKQYVGEF